MKLSILALVALCGHAAQADLQLTPKASFYELEGRQIERVSFFDGPKEITYKPPGGWDYSGSGNKLTLLPKDKTQAEGSVTKFPLPQTTTFDAETRKALVAEAIAQLPGGSTNVQVLTEQQNPVIIANKETFMITMSYTLNGEHFGRSLMFLNLPTEQLRFKLVSRLADFAQLQGAFLGSHFSWQHL